MRTWSDLHQQFADEAARVIVEYRTPKTGCTCGECTHAILDVQQSDLLTAVLFLGHLERANGCGLRHMLADAAKADTDEMVLQHVRLTGSATMLGAVMVDAEFVREFARLVTNEALGRGPKWTDEHAAFTFGEPSSHYSDCIIERHRRTLPCPCGAQPGRPFVVPHFEFDGDRR
jgi:hypothetical protein